MLCGECKEGYAYSTSAQMCEVCEGGSISATQITTAVVVVVMAASAVVYWAGWAELLLPERWRGISVEDVVNLGTVRHTRVGVRVGFDEYCLDSRLTTYNSQLTTHDSRLILYSPDPHGVVELSDSELDPGRDGCELP